MNSFDHSKYRPFTPLDMPNRHWPSEVISAAPRWCSVDLRDGNQALIEPMSVAQKLQLFDLLLRVGFKEIEVGFPAASQTDFDFVRHLIERELIPDDVTVQVLTQARPALIERSFAALEGAQRAIMHVYNSTSTVQREQVFGLDRAGIKAIAVAGAQSVKDCAARYPNTDWVFQYSPESFTGTEMDFAVEVCDAVTEVWQPTRERRAIINLPATVEMSTANIYADQIEWFCNHVANRDALLVSLHTHNDRGCAVAAAELGVMAGADRVEGTLLGNGERTGNMDIVTMAMNLYSRGIAPQLDFSNMDDIVRCVKVCTNLPVHPRHPYAGELVFTAFSGSHQDAIKKCFSRYQPGDSWEVAYLPIDPADLSRSYQEVIRINSQSGKGGISYVLEQEHGLQLPRWLQIDFSSVVQRHAEQSASEVAAEQLWQLFEQHYLQQTSPYQLLSYQISRDNNEDELQARLKCNNASVDVQAHGSGVVEAFVAALQQHTGKTLVLVEYSEHALSQNANADAICYVQLNIDSQRYCGVGKSNDIVEASLRAILVALNQAQRSAEKRAA